MKALSAELLGILDDVIYILNRGKALPADLLERLETLWRKERPDDIAGLTVLLNSLQLQPDHDKFKNALRKASTLHLADKQFQAAIHRYLKPMIMSFGNKSGWDAHIPLLKNMVEAREPVKVEKKEDIFSLTRDEETEPVNGWLYPVFFGTNRKLCDLANPQKGFSSQRSDAVYHGRCDVWIPKTHRFGETGTPWYKRWNQWRFKDDHLVLRETSILTEKDLWSALQTEMKKSNEPHGLIYIHGYNVSFDNAAIRAAQMGFDLKVNGATAFFSWPSQGTLQGYPADAAAIEASEDEITNFLVQFIRQSGAAKAHLVAHSMGNRGLLRALQRIAADAQLKTGVKFGQIFLAAPDVDRSLFLNLASLYPQFSERTTLYASHSDEALAASSWLHDYSRAGYLPPVTTAAGIDTIVVPDFDIDLLGHSYFAQAEALLYDMHDLIWHNEPPNQRQRIQPKGDHWEMRL